MSPKAKRLLVIAGVIVAAAFAAVIAIVVLGGDDGKPATKAEYQATIVNARDRVDFAYAQITKADSVENLIERLDTASVAVGDVADDVGAVAVAPGFDALNGDLAAKLAKFSDALAAVADQFADPSSEVLDLETMTSLGFGEWDDVNKILTSMQEQGLEVELLERH